MNRILFEKSEFSGDTVTFGGARAEHVMNVLHGEVGQILKTGEIDGPVGTSEIVACTPGGAASGPSVTVRCRHDGESLRPWVDLVLAPPRPRVMKRLLPQLAALGVGRLVLVGAKKVEKDFWGATLLKPENSRPLLVDGLMQAGTSILPVLEIRRNFRRFVDEELDAMPAARRLVAHPYPSRTECAPACSPGSGRVSAHPLPDGARLVLAVGPEGGWTEEEVARFEAHGFQRRSLGARILRTDTATVALLAQLMPRFDS